MDPIDIQESIDKIVESDEPVTSFAELEDDELTEVFDELYDKGLRLNPPEDSEIAIAVMQHTSMTAIQELRTIVENTGKAMESFRLVSEDDDDIDELAREMSEEYFELFESIIELAKSSAEQLEQFQERVNEKAQEG